MPTAIPGIHGLELPYFSIQQLSNALANKIKNDNKEQRMISTRGSHEVLCRFRKQLSHGNSFFHRYLHLSNTENKEQSLTFTRYSWIRMCFFNNRNIVTARVLIELFKKAGYPHLSLETYLNNRTTRNIECDEILSLLIDAQTEFENGFGYAAIAKDSGELLEGNTIAITSYSTISRASIGGRSTILKKFHNPLPVEMLPPAITVEKLFPHSPSSTLTLTKYGLPKFIRSKEVTATYLRKSSEKGTLAPTHYIVKKSSHDSPLEGDPEFIIEGGGAFRHWAEAHLYPQVWLGHQKPYPKLHLTGLLIPEATGTQLETMLSSPSALNSNQVKQLSLGLLKNLEEYAQRGFIHGKLSPSKIFFNVASGNVKFIGTGSLAKISTFTHEREETTILSMHQTKISAFSHPVISYTQKGGLECDLFSIGIIIAQSDLLSMQFAETANNFIQKMEKITSERSNFEKSKEKIIQLIESCYPDGVSEYGKIAKLCVESSFEMIQSDKNNNLLLCCSREAYQEKIQIIHERLLACTT